MTSRKASAVAPGCRKAPQPLNAPRIPDTRREITPFSWAASRAIRELRLCPWCCTWAKWVRCRTLRKLYEFTEHDARHFTSGTHRGDGVLLAHLGSQCIESLHEDAHIHIASHELIAPVKIALGIGNRRGQNAGGLSGGAYGSNRCLDRRLYVGMAGIAEIPHRGRQVRGSDKDSIDARHTRDLLNLSQRFSCLYLHQYADLLCGGFQIIARAPEIVGASRSRNAPPAIGRIAATLHGSMRFFGGLHEGQQHGLGPDIQYALYQYSIVPCWPHDARGRPAIRRLQQRQQPGDFHRGVFRVEQNPIEAGFTQYFRGDGAAKGAPNAELPAALAECTLECVVL